MVGRLCSVPPLLLLSRHLNISLDNPMSSTRDDSETSSANFEALLNEALTKYTQKTGKNLRDHPLASNIDSCNSAESFLVLFQQQAQDFEQFRNGDSKLIEWLRPVVDGLLFISNSGVVDAVADIVRPPQGSCCYYVRCPTSLLYRCSPLQNMSFLRSASFSRCVSPSHSN